MLMNHERIDEVIDDLLQGKAVTLGDRPEDSETTELLNSLAAISRVAQAFERLHTSEETGLPFTHWGKLKLKRLLGAGAYGEVYLAHDPSLQIDVALKLFNHISTDAFEREKLLDEARRMAQVSHPNVVRVYGAELHEGRVGFWMDLFSGRTLEDLLATEGTLSKEQLKTLGIQLASALSAAHKSGILHGDIKSANVLLEGDSTFYLTDFGSGNRIQADGSALQETATPGYVAPEVRRSGRASVHSDLYSLGALLFRAATGSYPSAAAFPARTLQAAGVPRRIQETIVDCLHEDPEHRIASAEDVVARLTGTPRKGFGLAVVGVLSILAAVMLLNRPDERIVPDQRNRSVAVLVTSKDPDLQVDAVMAEELVRDALEREEYLRLVPREQLLAMEAKPKRQLRESAVRLALAKATQSDYLIDAVLGGQPGDVTLDWSLVRIPDGRVEAKGRELGPGVFEASGPMTEASLSALGGSLHSSALLRRGANPEALRTYAQGRRIVLEFPDSNAVELFRRSVRIDPTFVLGLYTLAFYEVSYDSMKQASDKAWEMRRELTLYQRLGLEAVRAFQRGDLAAGMATSREIAERWPGDYRSSMTLVRTLWGWWYFREALKQIEALLEFYPHDEELHELQEYSLCTLGRAEEAIALRQDRIGEKLTVEEWWSLAFYWLHLGNQVEAGSALKKAMDPDPTQFKREASLCAYLRGEPLEAASILEQAFGDSLDLGVATDGISPGLARLYWEVGLVGEARAVVDTFLGEHRSARTAGYRTMILKTALYYNGYWQRALAMHFSREDSLLMGQGSREAAGAKYWTSDFCDVLCLECLGRKDEALEMADRLLADPPGDVADYRLRRRLIAAAALRMRGDFEAASETLRVARADGLPFGGFDQDTRHFQAFTWWLAGAYDQAADAWESLLRIYGGHHLGRYWLGLAYLESGRESEGRRALQDFLDATEGAEPDHPFRAEAIRHLSER